MTYAMTDTTTPAQTQDASGDARLDWIKAHRDVEAPLPEAERVELKGLTYEQVEALLVQGLGEKRFRAQQVFQWMYLHLAPEASAMTNLARPLRERLERLTSVSSLEHVASYPSADGTTKLTFRCRDHAVIETVYIPAEGRNTLCISSQVGCAMGCTFCWTAKMGLRRNLSVAEIVDQVVWARRLMGDKNGHIGNIVFMGMGEPLHNYDHVVRSIQILTDNRGLDFSRRKITVSTSGLVPQLERLGQETDINIAISLNATTDEQRSSIMPINDRWNIEALMACLREYPLEQRQRITFEYVMIKGLNDSMQDAKRLVKLMRGMKAKVNLIPFNTHPNSPFETPDEQTIDAFQEHLRQHHVSCFRRATRGRDEMAACGQLGRPGDRKEPLHVRKRLEAFRQRAQQADAPGEPAQS